MIWPQSRPSRTRQRLPLISLTTALLLAVCAVGMARSRPALAEVDNAALETPRGTEYVAMGDSYSAGEGISGYLTGTETSTNTCHRSINAYPEVIARSAAAQYLDLNFVACSGAITDDFYITNHENKEERAQNDNISSRTGLITYTIGGNDVGFADVLKDCVYSWPFFGWSGAPGRPGCRDRQGAKVAARINGLAPDGGQGLSTLLREVAAKNTKTEIYVAGYPQMFGLKMTDAVLGCRLGWGFKNPDQGSRFYITEADVRWIRRQTSDLNSAIEKTVLQTRKDKTIGNRIHYVDLAATFESNGTSHGVCGTAEPWIQDLAFEVNNSQEASKATLHPNLTGQRRMATAIGNAIRATMPPAIVPPTTQIYLNEPFSQVLRVADARSGSWKVASGRLPVGIALRNGILSGTPTVVGKYRFVLKFTDKVGRTDSAGVELLVSNRPVPEPTPPPSDESSDSVRPSRWMSTTGVFEATNIECLNALLCQVTGGLNAGGILSTLKEGQWSTAGRVAPSFKANGVSCVSVSKCFAATSQGIYVGSDSTQWQQSLAGGSINGISCAGPDFCLAEGWATLDTTTESLIKWDGTKWVILGPTDVRPEKLQCLTAEFCAGASQSGQLEVIRGLSTAVVSTNEYYVTIACQTTEICFAGTATGGVSAWNGNRWSSPVTVVPSRVAGIECRSDVCYLADVAGNFARWTAAGDWESLPQIATAAFSTDPDATYVALQLTSLSCPGLGVCYALFNNGNVSRWNGAGWEVLPQDHPTATG